MEQHNCRTLSNHIQAYATAALLECASQDDYPQLAKANILELTSPKIEEDLLAFSSKDPASQFDPVFILKHYTSFSAVLHYRLANWIFKNRSIPCLRRIDSHLPGALSRRGKLLSGAEIHYRSHIGRRFVLDHGMGTVVGETCTIGDDCYVLGGVILGARGISGNPSEPRHPIIGNRVQIGAASCILGRVCIGDDVFIGPNCIISKDVPAKSKVTIITSVQVIHPEKISGEAHA
ncbi:MAG: serine O-acetyltransferase [Alcaligenes sp.]